MLIKKINLFKIFEPVNLLLVLSSLVSIMFVISITNINTKLKNYSEYYNSFYEIKVLDKELNNFVTRRAVILNFDELVIKRKSILELLNQIDTDNFYLSFRTDFSADIEQIKILTQLKLEKVERVKSLGASLIDSVGYLINLSKKIKNEYLFDSYEDNLLVEDALEMIVKMFMYDEVYTSAEIEAKLQPLGQLRHKYHQDEVDYLIKRFYLAASDLSSMTSLREEYLLNELADAIDKIQQQMEVENNKDLTTQRNFSILLFSLGLILFSAFIWVYIRAMQAREELKSFKFAVENSYNTIVITDENRDIVYVNDAFEKVSGYSKEEALGKNPRILQSGLVPRKKYAAMNKALKAGKVWKGEFINKSKHGVIFHENVSISPIFTQGDLKGYLAIKQNITDYIKEKEKVEYIAMHDTLTKLPNRHSLVSFVEELIENSKITKAKFAILLIDLDGFKFINDSLGHDLGDSLLVAVANRLKDLTTNKGIAYRIGGDEFAIVYYYTTNEELDAFAEKLLANISKRLHIKDHYLQVTSSIGIAKYPEDTSSVNSLLKYSDTAMYKAKQLGKNRFAHYTQDLTQSVMKRLDIEQSFKDALINKEFYLVYQPKYSLLTNKVHSVEALVRWESKHLGDIRPDEFIHIAEESGFINDLGLFVFEQGCKDLPKLLEKYGASDLTINVSTVQLMNEDFPHKIEAILAKTEADPSKIGLELTETHIVKNIEQVEEILIQLKQLNLKILIDDFGTGYSSLQYLQRLPIDVIKIDKSFVHNLTATNQSIIKAVVAISKSFGYQTVAEGIETKEQELALRDLAVDYAQGFYFSRPEPL